MNFRVLSVSTQTRGTCLSQATFFGLTKGYIDSVYELFFFMKQKGNWNFFELYALPIKLRDWFFRRMIKFFEDANKEDS